MHYAAKKATAENNKQNDAVLLLLLSYKCGSSGEWRLWWKVAQRGGAFQIYPTSPRTESSVVVVVVLSSFLFDAQHSDSTVNSKLLGLSCRGSQSFRRINFFTSFLPAF